MIIIISLSIGQALRKSFTTSSPPRSRNRRQRTTLTILDLDETILDQQSFKATLSSYRSDRSRGLWRKVNDQHLVANGHRVRDQNSIIMHQNRSISIGIFRPNLMEFIHSMNSENSDLILYSLGIKDLVIYQAIFIEMYVLSKYILLVQWYRHSFY